MEENTQMYLWNTNNKIENISVTLNRFTKFRDDDGMWFLVYPLDKMFTHEKLKESTIFMNDYWYFSQRNATNNCRDQRRSHRIVKGLITPFLRVIFMGICPCFWFIFEWIPTVRLQLLLFRVGGGQNDIVMMGNDCDEMWVFLPKGLHRAWALTPNGLLKLEWKFMYPLIRCCLPAWMSAMACSV